MTHNLYRQKQQSVGQTKKEEKTPTVAGPKSLMDDPKIIQMGEYILQGLDDHEAAMLAGFSDEEVTKMRKESDEYANFVRLQRIKFKQAHLKTISQKSDAKTSQWMLEKSFPDDYGKGASGGGIDGTSDGTVITAIIRSIQRKDATPVKTTFKDITNTKEAPRHDEAKRLKENTEGFNVGGKAIL